MTQRGAYKPPLMSPTSDNPKPLIWETGWGVFWYLIFWDIDPGVEKTLGSGKIYLMPRRQLLKNTFYHIYNRSFDKESIFISVKDYERFFNKLELLKKKFPNIKIFSYCILPNHFHFLVKEIVDQPRGSKNPGVGEDIAKQISSFFSILLNSYVKYFNQKYKKQGGIFKNRFQTRLVENEKYLYQLKCYIERNAVKHGFVEKAEDWSYSSFSLESVPKSILEDDFDPYFE